MFTSEWNQFFKLVSFTYLYFVYIFLLLTVISNQKTSTVHSFVIYEIRKYFQRVKFLATSLWYFLHYSLIISVQSKHNQNFIWYTLCFFVIKQTRCTNFTNLFCHEILHISDCSSVHHQEFIHFTLSNGICHTGL